MIFSVYILKCADSSLYIGSTNNLERRLYAHNFLKRGAHYTKIRRPVSLEYEERHDSFKKARAREAELKTWKREEKLALIIKNKHAS